MAEIFTGLIGAVVGGLGAAAQYQASQEQAMIQLANLQFQKRMADEQMRMSQAGRTDAYGNQQRYNPATNQWETILTPTQSQIVHGGEQEQLKRLTEDATRNRLILEEARQRGLEAVPDYNKALAGFRYDQAPSRAADEDRLFSLMSIANQDQIGADRQMVGRALLRQGRGADFASLIKSMDDAQAQNIGGNLLQAYQRSIPQFEQDVQARQQHYLPLMAQLQKTMEGGMSSAPTPFSTVPQELSGIENQQAQLMQSAAASAASEVGGAYNAYARAAGEAYPNLSSLASLIAGIGGKMGKGNQPQYGIVPNQAAYDPGVGYTDPESSWHPPMALPGQYDGSGGGSNAGFDANIYQTNPGLAPYGFGVIPQKDYFTGYDANAANDSSQWEGF